MSDVEALGGVLNRGSRNEREGRLKAAVRFMMGGLLERHRDDTAGDELSGPDTSPRGSAKLSHQELEDELKAEWLKLPKSVRDPVQQRHKLHVAWLLNPVPGSVDLLSLSDKDSRKLDEYLTKRAEILKTFRAT